jgi:PGF-CTERM protein
VPIDDQENVGLKVTLWVRIVDRDSTHLTVTFYNAATHELLGTTRNVRNNTNASCRITLPFDTTFAWYAVASDSVLENRSDIWFFTTRRRPPENERPVSNPGGPYTSRVGQILTFNGTGSRDPDGAIIFYRWNFGDGSSEILDDAPTHQYTDAGLYTVTLTVVDDDGRSSTTNTTVTVLGSLADNLLPLAQFTCLTKALVNNAVTFDASASHDQDGSIAGYQWDFDGDGVFDTEWVPSSVGSYSYPSSGSRIVTLQVKDDAGAVATYSATITIAAPQTPGFEAVGALLALVVALGILSRRTGPNNKS